MMGWLDGTYSMTTPRHLASKDERARQDRIAQRRAAWRRGEKVRERWSPDQHEEEEARLVAEVAAFMAARDARKVA